jgi:transcriptional antiterminator NusG
MPLKHNLNFLFRASLSKLPLELASPVSSLCPARPRADKVNSILFRQATAAERPRPKMTFEKNERVKIIDGPFANFSGTVDEINPERNTLRVMVTIFGRSTPVELDFLQVNKDS